MNHANSPFGSGTSPEQPLSFLWQGRWIIILATVLGATFGIFFAQNRGTVWRANSVLFVERSAPFIIGEDAHLSQQLPRNYANTQAALLRSTPVLTAALGKPGISGNPAFNGSPNEVSWLKRNLDVDVGDQDDLITVSLDSPLRQSACDLINAVVDSYRELRAKDSEEIADIIEQLARELEHYEGIVQREEQALVAFHEANPGIRLHDEMADVASARLKQLTAALTQAELDAVEARTSWEAAQRLADDPELLLRMPLPGGDIASGPVGSSEEARQLRDLRAQQLQLQTEVRTGAASRIAELQAERQRLLTRVTAEHPAIAEIDSTLAELTQQAASGQAPTELGAAIHELERMADEDQARLAGALLAALEQRHQSALQWRDEIDAEVAEQEQLILTIDPKRAEYRALQTRLDRARKIADLLYERVSELDIIESMGDASAAKTEALVFEYATPQSSIVASSKRALAAVATFLGFILGAGIAWLRSLGDERIRSFDDASKIMPVLSTVPRIDVQSEGVIETWREDPEFVEAMRSLRVALCMGDPDATSKVFQVASPEQGDGKSLIAAGLGMALAHAGKRTLLIDADFRSPEQPGLFDIEETGGFGRILEHGLAEFEPVATRVDDLHVLPTGMHPFNLAELLGSPALGMVLEELRDRYDCIVIDSPPLLRLTEARILAAACDETLMVVRAGRTTTKLVNAAATSVLSVGGHVSGAVLNRVSRASMLGTSVQAYGALILED